MLNWRKFFKKTIDGLLVGSEVRNGKNSGIRDNHPVSAGLQSATVGCRLEAGILNDFLRLSGNDSVSILQSDASILDSMYGALNQTSHKDGFVPTFLG